MKQKILLSLIMLSFIAAANAQKKEKSVTGYAITATEKGGRNWKEVTLVNVSTGERLQSIYNSKDEVPALNARTGKPVVKSEPSNTTSKTTTYTVTSPERKVVNLDQVLDKGSNNNVNVRTYTRVVVVRQEVQKEKPFATNSAAMAYDKKHERLYYTPMGINQLRYIDLRSKTPKVYFFEEEAFGVVANTGDVNNQITRMVIASDGNGYALSNDGNHLIRFSTGKKTVITDLGAVADDASNGANSVHSRNNFGGDLIADANKNLYLITANRAVYKISIETKTATFLGKIKGLPERYSTNGAMVEEGSKVIVASSESTEGYYRFDLNTLQSEKVSGGGDVFSTSDLANGNLAFEKNKKEKEEAPPVAENKPVVTETAAKGTQPQEQLLKNGISVYPNPITEGVTKVSFANQPTGRYQVQLLDLSGRLISAKEVNVNSESQVEEIRFPELSVKGNYLLRISGASNKTTFTSKIVVQ